MHIRMVSLVQESCNSNYNLPKLVLVKNNDHLEFFSFFIFKKKKKIF